MLAPDNNRRPGFSRKAQYGLFFSFVVTVVGVVAGLLLSIISVVDPAGFASLRRAGAEIAAPVSRTANSAVGSVTGIDDWIGSYFSAGSQNRSLRRQLAAAHRKLVTTAALAEENRQLRAILQLSRVNEDAITTTRLLSSTATSVRRIALLDAGRNKGVMAGQAVRAADGLIGRTLDVGPTVARVLLLTDPDNVVPVRRASDGLPALATGRGTGDLDIRPLNMGVNPFRAGDILVTSGTGGLYRPNIPVAIVVKPQSDGALARPLADPAKADAVIVYSAYAGAPAPAPAVPTPTPAPKAAATATTTPAAPAPR